jgi:hypothetical protein
MTLFKNTIDVLRDKLKNIKDDVTDKETRKQLIKS